MILPTFITIGFISLDFQIPYRLKPLFSLPFLSSPSSHFADCYIHELIGGPFSYRSCILKRCATELRMYKAYTLSWTLKKSNFPRNVSY